MAFDILLILHFVGLMMGAGGGFGSMIAARTAAAMPPEAVAPLRSLGPRYARFSAIGLALMWASGLGMVAVRWGIEALPMLFWVKIAFVLTLTGAAIATELTYAQIKAGKPQLAARLPVLGPISGLSSLLAVIFAVLAFH